MYDKLTAKERGLIKGSLRRTFARSELRNQIIQDTVVEHHDPERPRVKKWCKCPACGKLEPKYKMTVDHLEPVVPLDKTLDDLTCDELVARLWCSKENLQALCEQCHGTKTKAEAKIRRENKKRRKELENVKLDTGSRRKQKENKAARSGRRKISRATGSAG